MLSETAINRYEQAFSSRNAVALKDVWPSIPRDQLEDYRRIFSDRRNVKSIHACCTLGGEVEISGDTATVTEK